jgi:adenosine deaminase
MSYSSDNTWFERVPKVELHLHLEGAIPYEVLWELVKKYGGDSSVNGLQALKKKFIFKDFPHFLETWRWKNQFLREYDDFTLIAEAVARDLVEQNIHYVEMFYSPTDFSRYNLKVQEITKAVHCGICRVPDIKINLVTDFCRDNGPENAARVLSEINEVKDLDVIGITIGGSEHDYPPEPFAGVYEG